MTKYTPATIGIMLALGIIAAAATGCSLPATNIQPGEYTADVSYSHAEYMLFLNREITTTSNEIVTQISMMQALNNQAADRAICKTSAEESVRIITESRQNVETMRPPEMYTENRESVMTYMQQAIDTLEAYINALDSGGDVSTYQTELSTINIAMTGQFNSYWE